MADNQQATIPTSPTHNAEDTPHPPKQQHVLQLGPAPVNTAPWRYFFAFSLLALIDLAFNVSAGAAAAHLGAKLNHVSPTPKILQIGAQTGAIKSAITTFRDVVLMTKVNLVLRMLMLLLFSSFGICLVVVAQVCNQVLHDTPKEYLIAALVASIPLIFESVRTLIPQPERKDDGSEDLEPYVRPILSICLIGTDALGAYVFARMCSNQGRPISNYHAAASAGALFGTLTFLARLITGIVAFRYRPASGRASTIFGKYEMIYPEPIIMTEEEWEAKNRLQDGAFDWLENGPKPMLRLAARLLWFVPMNRQRNRKWRENLRRRAEKGRKSETAMDIREMMSYARSEDGIEMRNRSQALV
ncbi:hypothetical protein WAI453_001787 [Rhynchosporium graminicola]|uniref:Uncharacterized protein n=1 Tax=Rhynchosporium graminicola TaxID=2792576 RepID=A0A1E1LPN8_9HELO|nr:uncharacterized protein RCO7_09106 [Rhynchosporium commune]